MSRAFLNVCQSQSQNLLKIGSRGAGATDDDSVAGRGLALIQSLVTTVTFERQEGTNTCVLTRTSQG